MSRIRHTPALLVAVALASAAVALSASAPPAKPTAKPGAAAVAPAAAKAKLIERGKHLVTVSGCGECHTPGTLFGAPDFSSELSGSELGWQGPWGTSYARNLTPDLESGIGYYKEQEIVNAIKSGRRLDGKPMMPPMPWQDYVAYDEADLHAIATYLLSLKPVPHDVPDALPPGKQPSGSFLAFPAPPAWDAPRTTAADSSANH
jgi:mono/diheme cytochrome c family protein